jgi:cobalt-zinc-cadmium efflux system membrane fusion protein
MMKYIYILLFTILYSSVTLSANANESHDHKGGDHEEVSSDNDTDDHELRNEDSTEIANVIAQQVGIQLELTGPQTLEKTFTSYGRLATAPEHTSHVRARFPGVVRSVSVNIGDKVDVGDLLAIIESNESLKRYELLAPISGTIIQRHANAGEMTQEQVLFSISNFESLWAEFRIFPTQQQYLAIGQSVHINAGEKRFNSNISHLLAATDSSPYLIARAKISDASDGWFPGMMVEGEIVISKWDAPLAIKISALQTLENRKGIFVKTNDRYQFSPLELGRSDYEFSEVLSGVEPNTEYVTENSYLIKADIEKSEAEHDH